MFDSKFTIISAELSTLGKAENALRTKLLKDMLEDIGAEFLQADGCYKGTEEVSFVVKSDITMFKALLDIASKNFAQESVLYVDEDKQAYLMYCDMFKTEQLGTFTQVNPKRLESLEAYSVIDNCLYAVI
jgi:hypothetical protein